ncbi:hypothetical protein FHG87_010434 [Trinorchestia longiramus]|nr:hypothetical protein FHG87_010434 [Trinorchestia longiramus]
MQSETKRDDMRLDDLRLELTRRKQDCQETKSLCKIRHLDCHSSIVRSSRLWLSPCTAVALFGLDIICTAPESHPLLVWQLKLKQNLFEFALQGRSSVFPSFPQEGENEPLSWTEYEVHSSYSTSNFFFCQN